MVAIIRIILFDEFLFLLNTSKIKLMEAAAKLKIRPNIVIDLMDITYTSYKIVS